MELWAPGFCLAQPGCCRHLRSTPADVDSLSVSLYLSNSVFSQGMDNAKKDHFRLTLDSWDVESDGPALRCAEHRTPLSCGHVWWVGGWWVKTPCHQEGGLHAHSGDK